MALLHRFTAVLLTCLVAVATQVGLSAPAYAEDGFTYWGYYHRTGGEWTAAQTGAGDFTPKDGSVEGWHYAVTGAMPSRPPRTDATFGQICAGTEAVDGKKRVAVAIDYGTGAEAPAGAKPPKPEGVCAVVAPDANGQQVIESVAPVRVEGGLSCAIDGYPPAGCGEEVSGVTIPTNEQQVDFALPSDRQERSAAADQAASGDEGGGVPWTLVAVGVLVVLLAAGAALLARRRA